MAVTAELAKREAEARQRIAEPFAETDALLAKAPIRVDGKLCLDAGVKHDDGKLPMTLLDRHALEEIARVLAFGAQKYGRQNWRKGISFSRLLDAAQRHLLAYADGEDKDPETGRSHLAHAGCCIMFALRMERDRPDLDDRMK